MFNCDTEKVHPSTLLSQSQRRENKSSREMHTDWHRRSFRMTNQVHGHFEIISFTLIKIWVQTDKLKKHDSDF